MSEIITAVTWAAALAATFGIAYCFAWLSLRTLMALMPAQQIEQKAAPVRHDERFGLFRRFALGQKH